MKIFIIGIGGQVGTKLAESAVPNGHEVHGGHMSRPWRMGQRSSIPFDKRDRDHVFQVLLQLKPDVVIDTGALHNVDYCETHPDEAIAINAAGTLNVTQACGKADSQLIFVSTDFVFNGSGAPYTEESKPDPLSVYAKSKLLGEGYALSDEANAVVRPSVIYSWVSPSGMSQTSASGKPLNFAAWLVSQLGAKKAVEIVNDQIASPTLADDLAKAILAIAESGRSGLFHTAGATPLSRFDFSVKVARRLALDEGLVHAISSSGLKQVAERPANSSLISDKIRREVGYGMMTIDDALDLFAREAESQATS